jgi:hypothetical protein
LPGSLPRAVFRTADRHDIEGCVSVSLRGFGGCVNENCTWWFATLRPRFVETNMGLRPRSAVLGAIMSAGDSESINQSKPVRGHHCQPLPLAIEVPFFSTIAEGNQPTIMGRRDCRVAGMLVQRKHGRTLDRFSSKLSPCEAGPPTCRHPYEHTTAQLTPSVKPLAGPPCSIV